MGVIVDIPRQIGSVLIFDKVLDIVKATGPSEGKRILDVPAGQGAFADELFRQKLGMEIRCGDKAPEGFKLNHIECDKVDLNKAWPYSDSYFDFVACIEGIEHLENPFHLIREAARVLRGGGSLIITTPNIASLRSRKQYLLYAFHVHFDYMVDPVEHINPISFIEIRYALNANGFRIEATETNRLLKKHSVFYNFLKLIVKTRGRSRVRKKPEASIVRNALLDDRLLFGEHLIVHAIKCDGA